MAPLPPQNFPPIKGVSCFCHDISKEGKVDQDGAQIPLPDGAITACQYGPYVCAADHHQYKVINLQEKRMIPLMDYADAGVDYPYSVALLRNNTIEIHNIIDQQLVQRVPLSSKTKTLSTGPGIKVRVAGLMDRLKSVNVLSKLNNDVQSSQSGEDIRNGLSNSFSAVPTRLIMAGSECIMALVTTPLVIQHHEFKYIYQKSGFVYLGETYFDLAFGLFEKGKADPRILIRLFSDLKDIICEDDPIYLYSGIMSIYDRLGSIDNIVSNGLVKNYDPHTMPDLDNNPGAQVLRKALFSTSKEMLQKFLMKDREQRKVPGRALSKEDKIILRAVDNALLRLYAECNSDDSDDLLKSLLESENECTLALCEQPLIDAKKIYYLALLYKEKKEYAKALEIWHSIIEQENPENDLPEGLHQIVDLLGKCDNPELLWKYAKWVIQKDEIMGAKARAKLIMFLQSSTKYNAEEILVKLEEVEILKAELAVIYGKLGHHEDALYILIRDLKDYRGAEIYCLSVGRIIGIVRKTTKKQVEKKISEEKTLVSNRKCLFLMLLKVYLNIDKG
ncbi:13769_t:CDS:10 [Racocetra fulgida]|uniref:13769_t:CDS:1 n=1 Tax=Racocetra fulgida TaxID=60492 RepID=A0A9N9F3X2_9GLOM|nr:13769_t:CDS:10 [Racocetra fulgida]